MHTPRRRCHPILIPSNECAHTRRARDFQTFLPLFSKYKMRSHIPVALALLASFFLAVSTAISPPPDLALPTLPSMVTQPTPAKPIAARTFTTTTRPKLPVPSLPS